MIIEAFGPDAATLLIAGAAGGLIRGLVSLRKVAAAGPITSSAAIALLIDIGTSVIIGAACSLFFHGAVQFVFGPGLDFIHADDASQVGTSGFLAGLGGITIVGWFIDTLNIRAKLKAEQPPTPPTPQGSNP